MNGTIFPRAITLQITSDFYALCIEHFAAGELPLTVCRPKIKTVFQYFIHVAFLYRPYAKINSSPVSILVSVAQLS